MMFMVLAWLVQCAVFFNKKLEKKKIKEKSPFSIENISCKRIETAIFVHETIQIK